jgi:predicted  nucleic acid-binding Zn-ribbon protein
MSKRLIIEQIARTKSDGGIEKLEFADGVNAIVGPQNTGKSTWLRMLDFLMADDGTPKGTFDEVLTEKYQAISSLMRFGSSVVEVERTWSGEGTRSQMLLNGDRIRIEDAQNVFLEALNIPTLRYPQGNIYASDRTWPTLGWRSLLRHIYRRQDFWSELVPRQPDSEQHACMLQFLGLAEHLFSSDLSLLTDKKKRLANLDTRREHFKELLRKLVPELMDEADADLSKDVTPQSISEASARIEAEINDLVAERADLVSRIRIQSQPNATRLDAIFAERSATQDTRDTLRKELSSIHSRLNELEQYKGGLDREVVRLERTDAAASILEDLRVTHCPACDQSVEGRTRVTHNCFLCGQPTADTEANAGAAARRLKFERDQITAERAEADELLAVASQDLQQKTTAVSEAERRLREIEQALRPFQASASAVVPEELALIDQRIGELNARRQTIEAFHGPLEMSEKLSAEITELQSEIKEFESRIAKNETKLDFDKAGERLSDSFNTYLDTIRTRDPSTWTATGEVSVSVSERRTQISIGGRPAKSKLGGTLTIYFLFAYHYALLNLSRYPDCHYPGLTILDFYPDIAKESSLGTRLHLVLSPFVELSQDKTIEPIQVITTSRALPKRPHINYIPLDEIWR